MEIILLEKIKGLGNLGDVIKVKNGYARNFLIPRGKCLYATVSNREIFDKKKEELQKLVLAQEKDALEIQKVLEGQSFTFLRNCSESGKLYGSVSAKDIATSIRKGSFNVTDHQVYIEHPIKDIGLYTITINLHSDVASKILVVVARDDEEATQILNKHKAREKAILEKQEAAASAEKEEVAAPIAE